MRRTHRRAPAQRRTLTPSERRLAELVARGLTNRQAAAELYVTVNTVEKSLTRIYAKLDVHSRTALAARLAKERQDSQASPPYP